MRWDAAAGSEGPFSDPWACNGPSLYWVLAHSGEQMEAHSDEVPEAALLPLEQGMQKKIRTFCRCKKVLFLRSKRYATYLLEEDTED